MLEHKYKIKYYPMHNCATLHVSEVGVTIPDGWDSDDSDYDRRIKLAELNLVHTKTHEDGWTIRGKICEDWFIWVNKFKAFHPKYGRVQGNFEEIIYSDTQEGYDDFLKNHPPREWNSEDI
jgi:hypothetical protein